MGDNRERKWETEGKEGERDGWRRGGGGGVERSKCVSLLMEAI